MLFRSLQLDSISINVPEESKVPISFGNQPLATHATGAPRTRSNRRKNQKVMKPHHGAHKPTASTPQVVRCPYFCPLFLSAAANQPPVAFSSKWSCPPSLMTSNNSTFIEHLYILTLMDISFCAGLFRSSKDHHVRRVSKIKARSIAVTVSYSLWGEALS